MSSLKFEIPCCKCQHRIVNLNFQSPTQGFRFSDYETEVYQRNPVWNEENIDLLSPDYGYG